MANMSPFHFFNYNEKHQNGQHLSRYKAVFSNYTLTFQLESNENFLVKYDACPYFLGISLLQSVEYCKGHVTLILWVYVLYLSSTMCQRSSLH